MRWKLAYRSLLFEILLMYFYDTKGRGFQSDFDQLSRDLLKTFRTKAIYEDNFFS